MEPAGGGGGNEEGTVTVVSPAQLFPVAQVNQVSVKMQLSPDNSVDSTHSITDENTVLNSPTNSCDDGTTTTLQEPDDSPEPGHYITVTGAGPRSYTSLTTVPATEGGSDDVGHSYVQYIESTGEQAIYTTTNGQMYPVYTVGESATIGYTASSGQYYATGSTTPVTYTQVANTLTAPGAAGTQILGNTAYLIQQGVEAEHGIITGTRASPQTVAAVQWLLENYETAEGVSLPRSTLYNHYLRHCYENKLDPVNAASFGKLIRSVFLGLRTRRLGTRGNSKYHYYGIRVKAGSVLAQISGDDDIIGRGYKRFRLSGSSSSGGPLNSPSVTTTSSVIKDDPNVMSGGGGGTTSLSGGPNSPAPLQEYLGDGTGAIPEFPEVDPPHGSQLPAMCSVDDLDTFRSIYRDHCEAFLDAIVNLEFATVETLWREFWRSQEHSNGDECEEEKYLSKTKLFMLSKFKPIQEFVRKVDFLFYQNLVQVLIPDVLRPIPSSLTQAIRNFAKGLESWLTSAMHGCPTEMIQVKVSAVSAFAQTLRRYTSLNHLAQAARAVLQNSVQINQMLADLNRVDFHNVQEQASWVCQCDASLVARLEADFKATLQQQNSLEQWAAWLKAVVNTVLKPYQGRPNFTMAARQLLLKWSFYSSMVIRDLTLRSAASFGSFHLIRLLYDEYMFYLIEHQVAQATGETPIAVMGEKNVLTSSPPPPSSDLTQQIDYELVNGQNGTTNNVTVLEAPGVPQQEIIIDIHQAKRLKMS